MKYIIILLFLGCNEEFIVPDNCIDEGKIIPYKDRVCTMEVDYTCGCNGYLYINPCHATSDGVTTIWAATVRSNCKQ